MKDARYSAGAIHSLQNQIMVLSAKLADAEGRCYAFSDEILQLRKELDELKPEAPAEGAQPEEPSE